MRLIGMYASPFVRRVAVSLELMGLAFAHEPLSVFRDRDRFAAINPAVKAPTLLTDEGTMLQDSTLILDRLERIAPPDRRLMPAAPRAFLHAQRLIGLALVACEKSVQLVYEDQLRPAEKRHAPWVDRVTRQLRDSYALLETACAAADGNWLVEGVLSQADVSAAVAWRFTAERVPGTVPADACPALAALSRRAEALPAFIAVPFA